MTYEEIVAKVSEDTGLSRKLVDSTYKSYWRAVREHIKSLPLKEDISEEEFKKLKPSVNIPSLGKLYVTYERYMKIRKQYIKNTN
jgi:hypothetical protein